MKLTGGLLLFGQFDGDVVAWHLLVLIRIWKPYHWLPIRFQVPFYVKRA